MTTGKRYAIIVGSTRTLEPSASRLPKNARDDSLTAIVTALGEDKLGDHAFKFLRPEGRKQQVLRNPPTSAITASLETVSGGNTSDDLIVFYYFGHAFLDTGGELTLAFKGADLGKPGSFSLNWVTSEIVRLGFHRCVLIVDCCHSGLSAGQLTVHGPDVEYFLMASTSRGWSYFDETGGIFTRALSDALTLRLSRKLVDPRREAITFKRWFDVASELVGSEQKPQSAGTLGDEVLRPEKVQVPAEKNAEANIKSNYNKMYEILRILSDNAQSLSALRSTIIERNLRAFQLPRRLEEGELVVRYISETKMRDYLRILKELRLVVEEGAAWRPTRRGRLAVAGGGARYNEIVMDAVFAWLPEEITREQINQILFELAEAALLPNVKNVIARLGDKGLPLVGKKKLRTAMRLLSYGRVIARPTRDTYFPGFLIAPGPS